MSGTPRWYGPAPVGQAVPINPAASGRASCEVDDAPASGADPRGHRARRDDRSRRAVVARQGGRATRSGGEHGPAGVVACPAALRRADRARRRVPHAAAGRRSRRPAGLGDVRRRRRAPVVSEPDVAGADPPRRRAELGPANREGQVGAGTADEARRRHDESHHADGRQDRHHPQDRRHPKTATPPRPPPPSRPVLARAVPQSPASRRRSTHRRTTSAHSTFPAPTADGPAGYRSRGAAAGPRRRPEDRRMDQPARRDLDRGTGRPADRNGPARQRSS